MVNMAEVGDRQIAPNQDNLPNTQNAQIAQIITQQIAATMPDIVAQVRANMNSSNANSRNANPRSVTLGNANLGNTNTGGTNSANANPNNTNPVNANLGNANTRNANLGNANAANMRGIGANYEYYGPYNPDGIRRICTYDNFTKYPVRVGDKRKWNSNLSKRFMSSPTRRLTLQQPGITEEL
ncbi:hypothetical protein L1987_43427 [Smallanthus sonchifolius]|uniref:Uncharacterized protein n=1 Tax=Smallanthus sonchifolius TaxID=185202 RepID=A0ACB9GL13_9ASTR|nr:hypothetical protein L1987_43427 [Smallanthus sonchifolius]